MNHFLCQVIAPGSVKVVQGEGMPMFRNPYERGSLFIKFDVKFPENHFADEATIKVHRCGWLDMFDLNVMSLKATDWLGWLWGKKQFFYLDSSAENRSSFAATTPNRNPGRRDGRRSQHGRLRPNQKGRRWRWTRRPCLSGGTYGTAVLGFSWVSGSCLPCLSLSLQDDDDDDDGPRGGPGVQCASQ